MTTKTKANAKKEAAAETAKDRAPRKVRTLDERIAELEGKVASHRNVADKFQAELDRLTGEKQAIEDKKAAEVQMQETLNSKSKEELEAELAEAEEAAKKLAAIKAALKTKEEEPAEQKATDE